MPRTAVLLAVLLLLGAASASPTLIFPAPQSLEASGPPLRVDAALQITTTHVSTRLARTIERAAGNIRRQAKLGCLKCCAEPLPDGTCCCVVPGCPTELPPSCPPPSATEVSLFEAAPALHEVSIKIIGTEPEELYPSRRTCYNYTLAIRGSPPTAEIASCSVFGAAYALEGLTQLLAQGGGTQLPHDTISVRDAPAYNWRGLMIDTGRRFFPMPLVKNLLDTMAAVKLNVLHLHASDHCRFAVESKVYPNLTASLMGIHAGHYTQADIAEMISYAADRGVRVVPEFDVPGHARGLLPLEAEGVRFCTSDPHRSQLYNDPAGKTYDAVHSLLAEMATLFKDDVMHLGCDETSVTGPCSLASTFAFERKLATAVATELEKTPEGWEEIEFDAGAATQDTIVNAWTRHLAPEVTATGRRAVESHSAYFYFTEAVPGGPDGWAKVYHDIGAGVPPNETKLLLGGEMSMWSDTYCYEQQCGSSVGPTPVGAPLFPPSADVQFAQSIGGMIWPRGFVGAQAFWNFDASTDPSSDAFVAAIWSLNDQLAQRGSLTCPTNCSCDQLSACGKPYLPPPPPPPPPRAGAPIGVSACASPRSSSQRFLHPLRAKNANDAADAADADAGPLQLASDPSLCVTVPAGCTASNCYPLRLARCTAANETLWTHDADSSELRLAGPHHLRSSAAAAPICMDAGSKDSVGTYQCGSGAGASSRQPNQRWSLDADSGLVVSTSAPGPGPADFGGWCLTALGGATPIVEEA